MRDASTNGSDHWPRLAAVYSRVGPPLRPCEEDMSIVWRAVREHAGTDEPRVLVMGATAEYFRLPWSAGTELLAVDRNPRALEEMWPGPDKTTRVGDWRRLSLDRASQTIALCDGGLGLVSFPDELAVVVREVARILTGDGLFIARLFVPPADRESVQEVLAAFHGGGIRDVNRLKIRLWFAVQDTGDWRVPVATVWDVIADRQEELAESASGFGWPDDWMKTIEPYRGSGIRYYLPPPDDVVALVLHAAPELEHQTLAYPLYDTGAQCPTVVFRRRPTVGQHRGRPIVRS